MEQDTDNTNGDERYGDAVPPDTDYDPDDDPYRFSRPHTRATIPGAVAVVRRGMELLSDEDEWDPTEPQESDGENERQEGGAAPSSVTRRTYLDATVKNIHETSNKRKSIYASIVALILGGTTAGIVIAVSGSKSSTEPPNYTETTPVSRCDFTDMVQPDPILQCACDGKITVLMDNIRLIHTELKESFIPNLFPDESFDYPIESCEHPNAALLWLAVDADNQTPDSIQNRYLLSLLYAYWRGLEWTDDEGWLTPASECTWRGIECSGTLLSGVDLNENNLQGSLVTELGLFQDVQTFLLGMNELGGSLPSEIAGATSLEVLKLERNSIVGTIPASVVELSNLKEVHLQGNLMTGSILAEIINLTNLEAIDFSENDLTGSLPTNIGLLSSLKALIVSQNSLVGSIPDTIGLLTKLEELNVEQNQHTGTLPLSLYNCTTLDTLIVGFNNFATSSIPTTVGLLTNLEYLVMQSITLNGTIPSEIGRLTSLQTLMLHTNQLTGTIPSTLGNLALAEKIHLYTNQLQGSVPQEICTLTEIGVLKELAVGCKEVSLSGPDCDCCIDCSEV